jgi:hypothetical protein
MWVPSQNLKKLLLEKYELEHSYANDLYGFSDKDWEISKKFYNHTNYDQIYNVGEPIDYDIKITIDSTKDIKEFLQHIGSLREILENNEPGDYNLEGVEISIKELKEKVLPLKVSNPLFEMDLLKIE